MWHVAQMTKTAQYLYLKKQFMVIMKWLLEIGPPISCIQYGQYHIPYTFFYKFYYVFYPEYKIITRWHYQMSCIVPCIQVIDIITVTSERLTGDSGVKDNQLHVNTQSGMSLLNIPCTRCCIFMVYHNGKIILHVLNTNVQLILDICKGYNIKLAGPN